MESLVTQLSGGDRRSIGAADEVADEVLSHPERFGELFEAIGNGDPLVQMRAADAAEKVTRERPELLRPHKRQLIGEVAQMPDPEVRWHFCQIAPRADLTAHERQMLFDTLISFLNDDSRIVRTFSIQGLSDLAGQDRTLRIPAIEVIKRAVEDPSPAVRARARKLLATLRAPSG